MSYKSSATATHLPEVQGIHAKAIFYRMRPDDLRGDLERNHADAFGWALACCRWDRSQAEDTLQASYLKILDGRARWDGRSSFRTWFFGVVRRTGAELRKDARVTPSSRPATFSRMGRDRAGRDRRWNDAVARESR